MKKMIYITPLAIIFASLSSCEKDWVCKCTNQDGDTENFQQTNQTLNQARTDCKARNYDNTTFGVHTSLDCSLQ